MERILNELKQADRILATISVSQDNVFAMAAARTKIGKACNELKSLADNKEETNNG